MIMLVKYIFILGKYIFNCKKMKTLLVYIFFKEYIILQKCAAQNNLKEVTSESSGFLGLIISFLVENM